MNDVVANKKDATRLRASARAERKEQSLHETESVLVIPEEEAGILSPRQSPSAGESAARARTYRKEENGNVGVVPLVDLPGVAPSSPAQSAAQHARSNRERAIDYRKENQIGGARVAISKDGLPLIDCQSVDNVSGRIGDDTRSGSVVILIQDRQQIKVRCR